MNECQEIPRGLVVTRRNTAVSFDSIDEPLDEIPLLIDMPVYVTCLSSVLLRRDHRLRAPRLDRVYECITVIGLVGDDCLWLVPINQILRVGDIGLLSTAQSKLDWVAQSIDSDVDFRAKSATRATKGFFVLPPF